MGRHQAEYEFTFDEPIFAFGGIARDCEIKGETKRCGVILTTDANEIVRRIHVKGRMPVVIHKYDYKRWLNPDTPFNELHRMMQPLPDEETHAAKFDGPEPAPTHKAVRSSKVKTELPEGQASLFDI